MLLNYFQPLTEYFSNENNLELRTWQHPYMFSTFHLISDNSKETTIFFVCEKKFEKTVIQKFFFLRTSLITFPLCFTQNQIFFSVPIYLSEFPPSSLACYLRLKVVLHYWHIHWKAQTRRSIKILKNGFWKIKCRF